jgi:dynein heavy chain 1
MVCFLLEDFLKINDQLAKIKSMMQLSLADLLSDAVTEFQAFYNTGLKLSMEQLMAWMKKYPVQLVTLAIQVAWTVHGICTGVCATSQRSPRYNPPSTWSPCQHCTSGAQPCHMQEV